MAHPTQQYPPRTYSPHPNAGSPTDSFPGGPNAKRQRLSPNGQSPYGSPNMANLSLPNQVFSSPYIGNQANGTHHTPHYSMASPQFSPNTSFNHSPTYNSLNTPAPPPAHSPPVNAPTNTSANIMGPPGRPDHNKPTDLNELGDVLFGAGVDLREEEAALLRSRDNNQQQNLSFEDQLREASGVKYPFVRDNFYSKNMPGDRSSFYGAGTFNQQSQKEQSAEELAEAEQKKAIRKQAEIQQYHLNKPFLMAGNLERRLRNESLKRHVQLPSSNDILRPNKPILTPQQITVVGPDNNDVVKLVKGEPLLGPKNSMVEILSTLSLATEERLRMLVEDAAAFARGRRTGAHGLVPSDMTDLAAKQPNGEAAASLPTPENSAVSPKQNPLKRSYTEANQLPTPPNTQVPSRFSPNPITAALRDIARAEREAEEARLLKRKKRAEAAAADPSSRTGSFSLDTSTPGTPGALPSDVVPEPSSIPKKSALKKDAKKAPTEAQAFAASNKTLSMALGLGGAGGKKLSWMKQSSEPTNPYLANKKATENAAKAGKAGGEAGDKGTVGPKVVKERQWGEFREDGEGGLGIQLRDLIGVLEGDRRAQRALQRAYMRLNTLGGPQPRL